MSLLASIGGCDGGSPASSTPPAITLESAASCGSGWQPLTSPQPWDLIEPLVYHAGTLYYTSATAKALVAQPTDGSPATTLASVVTYELWVEGDNLLFSQGNPATQIYSLPLSGGMPQLVLDGATGAMDPGPVFAHAFTATDFYWTEMRTPADSSPIDVWQQSRAGGSANLVASLTFQDPLDPASNYPSTLTAPYLALTPDALLVANAFAVAVAVPLTGGAPLPLASPSATPGLASSTEAVGVDSAGVYWAIPDLATMPGSLILSPGDGGPARPLSSALPTASAVVAVISDGTGGWILVGSQEFDDQIGHTTVRSLDAQGTTRLLGCSPGDAQSSFVEQSVVAVAPDAVYVIARSLTAETWEIDRIAR